MLFLNFLSPMNPNLPQLCIFFILFFLQNSFSQSSSQVDSIDRPHFKFKNLPWYGRSTPFSIYTGAGKIKDRVAQHIEIGKSLNIIDLGVAFGRNSLRPDTNLFVEGKVTMDLANFGIFSNEMTIGAGKLFDSRGSLMLELTYTIFAQVSNHWGFGISTGFYDFSNEDYDSSKNFYGFYIRYGLQRSDFGGILNVGQGRSHHHIKHRVRGR